MKEKEIEEVTNAFNYFHEKGYNFSIDIYEPVGGKYSNDFLPLLNKYENFLNQFVSYFLQLYPFEQKYIKILYLTKLLIL